jgi:hypothetical protein
MLNTVRISESIDEASAQKHLRNENEPPRRKRRGIPGFMTDYWANRPKGQGELDP